MCCVCVRAGEGVGVSDSVKKRTRQPSVKLGLNPPEQLQQKLIILIVNHGPVMVFHKVRNFCAVRW